ncbi:hypothetical protein IJH74_01145 [Candidatus Saccharibacteria bacterium]|nr:hypothetical protein [Candidatus Saccharibacteria bacterium]
MENRIREYEKFIAVSAKKPNASLIAYHREMVQNFQHERLIHLIITLFFASLTILTIIITGWISCIISDLLVIGPLILLATILLILTLFYIKHYYFLENHIQKLYDFSKKLYLDKK